MNATINTGLQHRSQSTQYTNDTVPVAPDQSAVIKATRRAPVVRYHCCVMLMARWGRSHARPCSMASPSSPMIERPLHHAALQRSTISSSETSEGSSASTGAGTGGAGASAAVRVWVLVPAPVPVSTCTARARGVRRPRVAYLMYCACCACSKSSRRSRCASSLFVLQTSSMAAAVSTEI